MLRPSERTRVMTTAEQVLAIARSQVGTKESPRNSNNVKYNTRYYGHPVHDTPDARFPWCMAFQWWLFQEAGAPELFYGGGKTASCSALMTYAKAHGQWVTGGYQPGDIAIMDFPGNKVKTDHCGMVVTALATGVRTIEGNTSAGNDSNGGEVMERTRPFQIIIGAYRPHYDTEVQKKMDNTPSNYAVDAVAWARDNQILFGNQEGDLLLHSPVTREQTLVFLYRYHQKFGK